MRCVCVCCGHLYDDKSFTPADDTSDIIRVPSIMELLYMWYSPPAVINRCDLTERITHEPSLIWSLFASDPGDSSSSHIHWPWSLFRARWTLKVASNLPVVFLHQQTSTLLHPSWRLTPESKGGTARCRGSAGCVGSDREIKNKRIKNIILPLPQ